MILSGQRTGSFFRTIPLHESEEHQTWTELSLSDVPALPDSAVVGKVTARTVRYDDGDESWFVDPRDKQVIRAYRKRRNEADIEAGAYPMLAAYFDEKGPL